MLRRLIIALCLLVASPSFAGMQVDPFPVQTMMAETGLNDVLDGFGDVTAQSIDGPGGPDNQAFIANWKSVASRMFDKAALTAQIADKLAADRLAPSDQTEIRTFYESALGRRVTALDISSSQMSQDQQDALIEAGKKLLPTLSPERNALLDQYWAVASAPTLALIRQQLRGQVVATILSSQRVDGVPWPDVNEALSRLMPKVMAALAEDVKEGNAALYADLSDIELASYLDFLKSPAGQRFYIAVAAALDAVVGDEMMRFGDAVAVASHGVTA